MVMKTIIYKKAKNIKLGLLEARRLEKKGYKSAAITDAKGIVPKAKRGTVIYAFKGKRTVPKGYGLKIEEF